MMRREGLLKRTRHIWVRVIRVAGNKGGERRKRRNVGFLSCPSKMLVVGITVASAGPGRSTGEFCPEFRKFLGQTVDFVPIVGTARGGRSGTFLAQAVVLTGIAARAIVWTSLRVAAIRCRSLARTIRRRPRSELRHKRSIEGSST